MARYEVQVRPGVRRDLRGIHRADVIRILARIEELASDPRPPGSEKLAGSERYRIRHGDYRIL
jgi:mRNA interferase RelE/StbE